jgi:hypothetical protein
MITAQEARELLKVQEVQRILAALEPQIREHSAVGVRVLRAYKADKMHHIVGEFGIAQPTLIQSLVCNELQQLGFCATMEIHGDPYVPRAAADDAGVGALHRNYVLTITW